MQIRDLIMVEDRTQPMILIVRNMAAGFALDLKLQRFCVTMKETEELIYI